MSCTQGLDERQDLRNPKIGVLHYHAVLKPLGLQISGSRMLGFNVNQALSEKYKGLVPRKGLPVPGDGGKEKRRNDKQHKPWLGASFYHWGRSYHVYKRY